MAAADSTSNVGNNAQLCYYRWGSASEFEMTQTTLFGCRFVLWVDKHILQRFISVLKILLILFLHWNNNHLKRLKLKPDQTKPWFDLTHSYNTAVLSWKDLLAN